MKLTAALRLAKQRRELPAKVRCTRCGYGRCRWRGKVWAFPGGPLHMKCWTNKRSARGALQNA